MDERKLKIFNAIVSFVGDLDASFGKKYKPVALYNRLTSKTAIADKQAIDRHIEAFTSFFKINSDYISNQKLSSNPKISYSERVYLDVRIILKKTDVDAHQHIHSHLATIYSLINIDNDQGREVLENLKKKMEQQKPAKLDIDLPDTKEGEFIQNTLEEMTSHFGDMEGANPMMMMTNMMQSGFFTKFMGDLQTKFSSGEMDMRSLMGTVTNVISSASPQGSQEAEQIKSFVNQSMSQVTAMSGDSLPPEVQDQMNSLLGALGPQKVEEVDDDEVEEKE